MLIEERQLYTYQSWQEWIDLVEDKDEKEEIQIWARRVKSGKISEDEFDKRVNEQITIVQK